MSIEVNVTPFESEELAHPQARTGSHQNESSLSQWQRLNQPSYFNGSQNNGNLLTFCSLPHESDGIRVANPVADSMIEEHAHEVSQLGTTRPGEGERPQPKFHLSGFKCLGRVLIPAWHDPFPQVAFVAVSSGESAPGEISSEFALLEMPHEISNPNCWLG
jgi:hypothetical protein